ncbi:MAG TPA: hypothetical protein VFH40_06760 [Gemmatimonadales bacterium]|nr:hypothetical protein [Gemmatimonadales bacterium]
MWSVVLSPRGLGVAGLLAGIGLAVTAEGRGHERTLQGQSVKLGGGTIQSFVTLDPAGVPLAIGVTLSAKALEQLPAAPNSVSRCFDLNADGKYTGHECHGDEERILNVPVDSSAGLPFRWIQVNWNPTGHYNTPYARPHFDFHFHTGDRARVEAIAPGRCGELVDCRDFKVGTRSIPDRYLPQGYIDIGAVVPRMGNHLLDSQSPELKDSLPFSTTFIYGAWDGELIFWEPMITLDFLRHSQACLPIRQPDGFRRAGYYPTQYCVRLNRGGGGERTVSLERFRYSRAS